MAAQRRVGPAMRATLVRGPLSRAAGGGGSHVRLLARHVATEEFHFKRRQFHCVMPPPLRYLFSPASRLGGLRDPSAESIIVAATLMGPTAREGRSVTGSVRSRESHCVGCEREDFSSPLVGGLSPSRSH
ncbi:unnamed protein product [Lampetra fluviatilis]